MYASMYTDKDFNEVKGDEVFMCLCVCVCVCVCYFTESFCATIVHVTHPCKLVRLSDIPK